MNQIWNNSGENGYPIKPQEYLKGVSNPLDETAISNLYPNPQRVISFGSLKNRRIFGSTPLPGLGMNLSLGGGAYAMTSSGILISLAGYDDISVCYLQDESGNYLLDEGGNFLISEACSATGFFFGGFDMSISGTSYVSSAMNLVLYNNATSSPVSTAMPLTLYGGGSPIGSGVNLYLHNDYSGLNNSVNLYVQGDGLNDDFIPINCSMPLFIQRYGYETMDIFISGASTPIGSGINLYLDANASGISGSFTIAMTGYELGTQSSHLYTHGW